MNQLVCVSHPLFIIIVILLRVFQAGWLAAAFAGSRSGVAAGDHLPRRHASSKSYPFSGKACVGPAWQRRPHGHTEDGAGSPVVNIR